MDCDVLLQIGGESHSYRYDASGRFISGWEGCRIVQDIVDGDDEDDEDGAYVTIERRLGLGLGLGGLESVLVLELVLASGLLLELQLLRAR